jgi:hypothetical protein
MRSDPPPFAALGSSSEKIAVFLSYKIVELFSEGLYASPNKAIEELVTNSFDAGAKKVHVLLSPNMHEQTSTITIIDNGEGMDGNALRQHWLIGISNKRDLTDPPLGRQQIGKFGIGKLATYVLANRLTHISKRDGEYYSTSMNYQAIDRRTEHGIEPKKPIEIPLRSLTEEEARNAVKPWTDLASFKRGDMRLFGKGAEESWTVTVMSSLKEKVHEIKPGYLSWVLRTALPLREDFKLWLGGNQLASSKQSKGRLRKWVLGDDLTELQKPAPKGVEAVEDDDGFALEVPGVGRVSGYAEAYKDLLTTGKSEANGRSYGFFVYVFGRLVNEEDGHFGISPNDLRHGSFNRFRCVIDIDSLDADLRSNREKISDGPRKEAAQGLLHAIFNAVRPTIEKAERGEKPGEALGRKVATSPASLSRRPILDLTRMTLEGTTKSRFLALPKKRMTDAEKQEVLETMEGRLQQPDTFLTGTTIDYGGSAEDGIARYEPQTGALRINAWHPFVAAFYDQFIGKGAGQPLEVIAMAEVLLEAHLHEIGVKPQHIAEILNARDQLLRVLAQQSGGKSPFSIASALREARNSPNGLEEQVCECFQSLGFEVVPIGGSNEPDGVATAHLVGADEGRPRRFAVSLEAKSKAKDKGTVAAKSVGISGIARQRDKYKCQHAIVVGRAFPTSREKSVLEQEIRQAQEATVEKSGSDGPRTITLIRIDDLARLVEKAPIKRVTLPRLREMFDTCRLDDETAKWVDGIEESKVKKPPYKQIVRTIHALQVKRSKAVVQYSALINELSHLVPPIMYDEDEQVAVICRSLAIMSGGAMHATGETVELDQSAENVIKAIESAMKEEHDA